MSDLLWAWLEDVQVRLRDAELGGLGTRDAVGEDALQADNTAKLVYDDLPALIAKIEELAGGLREAEIVLADWCSVDRRDPESAIHDKAPKFVKALALLDGEKGGGGA